MAPTKKPATVADRVIQAWNATDDKAIDMILKATELMRDHVTLDERRETTIELRQFCENWKTERSRWIADCQQKQDLKLDLLEGMKSILDEWPEIGTQRPVPEEEEECVSPLARCEPKQSFLAAPNIPDFISLDPSANAEPISPLQRCTPRPSATRKP